MIQKFKRKTIWILTMIFWVILIGILHVVNVSNYQSNLSETRKLLSTHEIILDSGEVKNTAAPVNEGQKLSSIYSVTVNDKEEFKVIFYNKDSGYSENELIRLAKGFLNENKEEGVQNHFRYKIAVTDSGRVISFIDYSLWEQQQYRMLVYSFFIGFAGVIILFFVAFFLTGWLIKPVVTAFEKQKQFISDAGHELKTPLTVMKASLDMLENEFGDNKYFGYIKEENNRMTALIYELLSLSSLDNTEEKLNFEKLDLSRIVEGTCLPFECLAYENGIKLALQIQEGIYISGIEKQIKQLIEVLADNAIKHTFAEGTVMIELKKEKGKTVLSVRNQGEPIPEKERGKIFDRFYRVDKARKRKEDRYGLGLAIASSIAELHKSRISVECKDNWTIFSVVFNRM